MIPSSKISVTDELEEAQKDKFDSIVGRTLVLPPEQCMYLLRRGDFQFIMTRVSVDEIYDNVQDVLTENKTVYMATDE